MYPSILIISLTRQCMVVGLHVGILKLQSGSYGKTHQSHGMCWIQEPCHCAHVWPFCTSRSQVVKLRCIISSDSVSKQVLWAAFSETAKDHIMPQQVLGPKKFSATANLKCSSVKVDIQNCNRRDLLIYRNESVHVPHYPTSFLASKTCDTIRTSHRNTTVLDVLGNSRPDVGVASHHSMASVPWLTKEGRFIHVGGEDWLESAANMFIMFPLINRHVQAKMNRAPKKLHFSTRHPRKSRDTFRQRGDWPPKICWGSQSCWAVPIHYL